MAIHFRGSLDPVFRCAGVTSSCLRADLVLARPMASQYFLPLQWIEARIKTRFWS
jgi:hypothetical protein